MDLTGKLIIKAQLGDDIRRIPIHNEDITYDELMLMMLRVFRGKMSHSEEITIKYKDEDGDLVTIFDSADLCFAIQCSRILRLTLFVNGEPLPLETSEVQHIRKELQNIRNRVNHLLDTLEISSSSAASLDGSVSETASVDGGHKLNVVARPLPTRSPLASGKEFDPLTSTPATAAAVAPQGSVSTEEVHRNVASSFGLQSNDAASSAQGIRSNTPNSVGAESQTRYSTGNQFQAANDAVQDYRTSQQGYYQDPSSGVQAGYPGQQQAQPNYTQQSGYAVQPHTGFMNQQQPVQTGYNPSSQPAQTGYVQQPRMDTGGYSMQAGQYAVVQNDPAMYATQQSHATQYRAGVSTSPAMSGQATAVMTSSAGNVNPYARGGSLNYPRPQGQYPQQPAAPASYQ